MANPENEKTSSRIYGFEAAMGIWRGLSARVSFPLLEVDFAEGGESGSEFGLGDLSLWLRYGVAFGGVRKPLRLGVAIGAFFPTGGTVQSDIPSNPNFVSGTMDPLLSLDASYEINSMVSVFTRVFTRMPSYENTDGYQAGASFVYMGGLQFRLFESLMPSIALTGLNRIGDQQDGATVPDSGGDWIYLTPGLAYAFTGEMLRGLSLYASAQIPVYQFLNGTQLAEDFNLTLGLAYGFGLF